MSPEMILKVQTAFAASLSTLWVTITGLSALGFLVSLLMKDVSMNSEEEGKDMERLQTSSLTGSMAARLSRTWSLMSYHRQSFVPSTEVQRYQLVSEDLADSDNPSWKAGPVTYMNDGRRQVTASNTTLPSSTLRTTHPAQARSSSRARCLPTPPVSSSAAVSRKPENFTVFHH